MDARSVLRLKREFRSLADVRHPNLVKLHDLGRGSDSWFLTMEYGTRSFGGCVGPSNDGQRYDPRPSAAKWPVCRCGTLPCVNVIGFDDGPFARAHRGSVLLVGAVCAGTRLDGVVSGRVTRDGSDATRRMIELVRGSQFNAHVRAVLLQGIAVGGFNVVDVVALSSELGVPVLVVMRRLPDLDAVQRALFSADPPGRSKIRGARRKWQLIERAGPVDKLELGRSPPSGLRGGPQRLWVQRAGLTLDAARQLIRATTLHGHVPEPLRLAHLMAGGLVAGRSRGRA